MVVAIVVVEAFHLCLLAQGQQQWLKGYGYGYGAFASLVFSSSVLKSVMSLVV